MIKKIKIPNRFSQQAVDDNIARFNSAYGELNPGVTNVIFVHGELDPYRTLGVQTALGPSSPAFVIRGASQGNDLAPIDEEVDTPQLVDIKRAVSEIIRDWVDDEN